ncbi:cation/H(+) antiporter 25 [Phtheirospermum japonicum]|uniref:Cation/H(+) antiporter 25 n=1 Tax=Phtheirospermum japonicum TaxID=374723 RepID=A0A830CJA1_9LAMI|nr:cation/H(+) antiporter 25 [Phtheirospermum japonicum]
MVTSELIKKGLVICRKKQRNHPFGIFYGQNPLQFSFPLVLLQLSILIIVTRLVRFLLKPLRQPKVVSDILGGIILGPSVLGRSPNFHAYMFPDNAYYVIKNIGLIGFMYFLFLSGVKIDIAVIKRAEKKHWYIALAGVLAPLCVSLCIAFIERKSLDKETAKAASIWGISSYLSTSAFPVLYPIVRELNLLSSGIGRMALSTAVVSDVIGMHAIVIFEASKQGEHRAIAALWFLISSVIVVGTMISSVRRAMVWIIRTTPEGKPVDQIYVVAILLGVMVAGLVSDMFGLTIVNGPLWLGLAIPDGPPLGTIIVEKSEIILRNILMPFSFMYIGLLIDVSSMTGQWSHLHPLLFMVLATHVVKMVSTLAASRFFDLVIRDSLTLSLIMSLKGEVEIMLFLHLIDIKIIEKPQFTVMILSAVSVTALATPLISILYDPTRPYMLNKRRNIQHTPPNTELQIVACIHGEENLPGIMKLLQLSNPTVNSPLSVHALTLVELVGRSNPVLIDHDNEEEKASDESNFSAIHKALKIFQESRGESMKIHSYTTITSKKSMYQDICELALSKKANLIILPLGREKSVNSNVLANAPCSVGILVDKHVVRSSTHHRVAVLFLGGADCREALAYADRMAESSDISLHVVRFLSHENEGDNGVEKKLDDGLVTWFWVKSEGNSRIVYREVVVRNGEETIAAIQGMNSRECYCLWIVGRKHGINPVLLKGLSNWSESNEVGVIGDYLASLDFDSEASVLVVQQQILLGRQEKVAGRSFSFCTCYTH